EAIASRRWRCHQHLGLGQSCHLTGLCHPSIGTVGALPLLESSPSGGKRPPCRRVRSQLDFAVLHHTHPTERVAPGGAPHPASRIADNYSNLQTLCPSKPD